MKVPREVQINSLEDMCSLMCDNCLPDPEPIYSHCIRCGKPLFSAESRAKGYGKTCEKKANYENKLKLF